MHPLVRAQSGVALVLLSLALTVLLGFLALGLNMGYRKTIITELETAADAAAHAGAGVLCPEIECYEDALQAVRQVLQRHVVHGNLWDKSNIVFPAGKGPVWSGPNLRITVQRGRWWGSNEKPEGVRFISPEIPFEAFDRRGNTSWQAAHPGIPRFVAANAVYVRIERPAQGGRVVRGPDGEAQPRRLHGLRHLRLALTPGNLAAVFGLHMGLADTREMPGCAMPDATPHCRECRHD